MSFGRRWSFFRAPRQSLPHGIVLPATGQCLERIDRTSVVSCGKVALSGLQAGISGSMNQPNTADNPAGSLIIGEISLFCQPALPGVSRCVAPIPGSMNRSRTWKGGHDGMEPTRGALSTRGA